MARSKKNSDIKEAKTSRKVKDEFLEEENEDILKRRTTSRTVEFETIKEEKSVNYGRNKKVLITFSILSFFLLCYIVYLVVCAFIF